MKKPLLLLFALTACLRLVAQEGTASFAVLSLPVSSHVAGLGGENISVVEDTPWAGSANPALWSTVTDRSLGLGFMTYPDGGQWYNAQFVKAFGERHTAAFHARMMNYGEMTETDAAGIESGTFKPRDIVVGAAYSYVLSDLWAGGAGVNLVTTNYAGYNSAAVSVDLGLNYFNPENDLSVSLAARNIGAQFKSPADGRTAHAPFVLQGGLTAGMSRAPVRFSVTLTDLTRWKTSDYYHPADESLSFGKKLLNHVVVGVDVIPAEGFYLSAGYNFRRAYELKAAGSGHGAGLTFGGGLNLSRFKLGVSYAKYHVGAASLMFSAGYAL